MTTSCKMCVYVLVHMSLIYIRSDIKQNSYNAVVKSEGRKYNLDASLFHPKNRFYSLFLNVLMKKVSTFFSQFISSTNTILYFIALMPHTVAYFPPKIRSNNNFSIIERLCLVADVHLHWTIELIVDLSVADSRMSDFGEWLCRCR